MINQNSKFSYTADEFADLSKSDFLRVKNQDPIELSNAHGDSLINKDLSAEFDKIKLRAAAVLVPVIADGQEARVILTKRTEKLRKHSGQVAFAGGGVDDSDLSVEHAALREAHEEIGLAPEFVQTTGRLPIYRSLTGFSITPILAIVRPGFSLVANPDEVSDIFEVPLSHLMREDNHVRDSLIWQEKRRYFYTIKHPDHKIWGVTAGIIRTLYERLYK